MSFHMFPLKLGYGFRVYANLPKGNLHEKPLDPRISKAQTPQKSRIMATASGPAL
jgi:hypothetical protein